MKDNETIDHRVTKMNDVPYSYGDEYRRTKKPKTNLQKAKMATWIIATLYGLLGILIVCAHIFAPLWVIPLLELAGWGEASPFDIKRGVGCAAIAFGFTYIPGAIGIGVWRHKAHDEAYWIDREKTDK
jgi:hypothetical protein